MPGNAFLSEYKALCLKFGMIVASDGEDVQLWPAKPEAIVRYVEDLREATIRFGRGCVDLANEEPMSPPAWPLAYLYDGDPLDDPDIGQ